MSCGEQINSASVSTINYDNNHGICYRYGILIHWGWVTHIYISKLTTIGSDNGLSPAQCQAVIWANTGILLIWSLRINLSEILSEMHAFSFKKMHLKMSSLKWQQFCFELNVLIRHGGHSDCFVIVIVAVIFCWALLLHYVNEMVHIEVNNSFISLPPLFL